MNVINVLITSKSFALTNPSAWTRLEEKGFGLRRLEGGPFPPEILAGHMKGVHALVVGNDTVNAAVIDAADGLKLIHMHGIGLDGIDCAHAKERGIAVLNTPGANCNAVAEMTLAMLLNAGRGVEKHARLLREGRWERTPGREVGGSTVGVFGLGNIGRRVVELLAGFGASVVAFDPFADARWAAEHSVRLESDPDAVFAAADYLVLTLPLTEETRGLVNDRTLALMKPTAYVVNAARGGLVDDAALCRAISGKRLAGAALDAFSAEPLPMDSPLRCLPEIALTPHLAATSVTSAANVSSVVADNLIKFFGRETHHIQGERK